MNITNLAVLTNATSPDIIATNIGGTYAAKTPEVFQYDADGNLTNDGRWSYTWDAENRLIKITSVTSVPINAAVQEAWSYLPDGRWGQVVVSTWQTENGSAGYASISTNRFLWDGQVLAAEVGPGGAIIRSYMRGTDLSGTTQGAGGVGGLLQVSYHGTVATNCFVAYDGNGNVAALVNAADGTIAANYEYDPFGQTIRRTGPMASANPIRFSTQYADDNAKNIKYLYRVYSASTGKWLSRDIAEEKGSILINQLFRVPFQLNLYNFTANNPIDSIDKLGLCTPGCNRALFAVRVVPDGDSPDINEELPELVGLAKHTEEMGWLMESGATAASALIEDVATVSASAFSDEVKELVTPPAPEMADYIVSLKDKVGNQHGWNAYYRATFQTCKCRSLLGRALAYLNGNDKGYWANLASDAEWHAVTENGNLNQPNYWTDPAAAYAAGTKAGKLEISYFERDNKICN